MPAQTPGQPTLDVAVHHPELAPAAAAARQRDWLGMLDLLAKLDTAGLFLALRAAETHIDEAALHEIRKLDTGDAVLVDLITAGVYLHLGWKARTGHLAANVSQEQFTAFHDYLRRAERVLLEVTAQEPGNVAAWTLRLMTARGLELGQNEAKRRYDRLAKTDKHFLFGQGQLLQQICPKWGGTVEEMFEFARGCVAQAREGSVNGSLVVEAHFERWIDLGDSGGKAYLALPEVQREVADAAARTVLHPSFQKVPGWVRAHNYFAAYWSMIGNHHAAAVHFRILGDCAAEFPWAYLGDHAEMFARNRSKALAKG